jgi:hypothetical protein
MKSSEFARMTSQLHDIGMLKFLEALDFPEDIDVFPAFVLALHFLDGHYFVVWSQSLEDHSERAISDVLNYLIFLHLTLTIIT